MVDIQSAAAEIRRGIKKDRRNKPQGKNIMSASVTQGGHNKIEETTGGKINCPHSAAQGGHNNNFQYKIIVH